MSELRKLNINNQVNNKELEQCGRRLCCCFGGVPTFSNINIKYPTYSNITSTYSIVMSSDGLLKSLKSLFREAKGDISEIAVDRTQGIGPNYLDRFSNNNWKILIVRLTIFQHRTLNSNFSSKSKHDCRIPEWMNKSIAPSLKKQSELTKSYLNNPRNMPLFQKDVFGLAYKVRNHEENKFVPSSPVYIDRFDRYDTVSSVFPNFLDRI